MKRLSKDVVKVIDRLEYFIAKGAIVDTTLDGKVFWVDPSYLPTSIYPDLIKRMKGEHNYVYHLRVQEDEVEDAPTRP